MVKSILVPVAGSEDDRAHLQAALAVARRFAAHLDVLHVRPDPAQLVAAAASAADGGAAFVAALVDQFERDAQARQEAAQKTFAAFVKDEHLEQRERADGTDVVSVAWLQQTGYAGESVAQAGRLRDLIVVGRSPVARVVASGTLEMALMDSGRPLLILPPGTSQVLGRTVAIAWKDAAEAARAVVAAMPFLAMASRVVVIEVAETESPTERKAGGSGAGLAGDLAWHKIKAEARIVASGDRPGPEALLAAVRDVGADLVVMGAYGHSRVREMIFGGFTRGMLHRADLPVLMFH